MTPAARQAEPDINDALVTDFRHEGVFVLGWIVTSIKHRLRIDRVNHRHTIERHVKRALPGLGVFPDLGVP